MSFSNLNKADAIRYAYRLLSYRDRSEKELTDKLKWKGFSEEIIQQTINHLSEKGFIGNPKSQSKSVVFSEEGFEKSKIL
ncbi:MAG: DUF6429 family protein, partial [Thermodesulfovibrionales bacterium]|nr:DUF6429 family protein [Thermodesulfovibrionales bacterium]